MIAWRKIMVVSAGLAVFGLLRLGIEQRFTRELRESGLHAPRLEIETSERLGQTGAVVAFGGLRTLIAALWNLRAFGYFETQDWFRLEEAYRTIVTLAPRTRFYWDTGAWHLAYNASVYYREEADMPPLRRREMWKDSILRGIAMLERGIRNNPDDWVLPSRLAALHGDRNKLTDYPQAARWYQVSIEHGAPDYIRRAYAYTLARIPGRRDEALRLIRELHSEEKHRVPSINCLRYALEARADPGRPPAELIAEAFENEEQALQQLSIYAERGIEDFPQHGVEAGLRWLKEH